MKDLRPIYYHEARERLVGNRLAVYDSLFSSGPSTGTELAASMGWAVTSVRPRLTELRDIHAVIETGIRRNGEHEFRAQTATEIEHCIAALHAEAESEAREARHAAKDEQRIAARIHAEQQEQQQELFA
jgi:hypothetical protein